jgi:hypothetical protein
MINAALITLDKLDYTSANQDLWASQIAIPAIQAGLEEAGLTVEFFGVCSYKLNEGTEDEMTVAQWVDKYYPRREAAQRPYSSLSLRRTA